MFLLDQNMFFRHQLPPPVLCLLLVLSIGIVKKVILITYSILSFSCPVVRLMYTGYGMCLLKYLIFVALQYVMIVLKGSIPISFGGTQEPAAFGELVSIGGLNPDVNKNLSSAIASILEKTLSVPKSRLYLKFYDSQASHLDF